MTPIKATKAGDCSKCGKPWSVGDLLDFEKGQRIDGTTFNRPVHAVCPGKNGAAQPGPAGATPDGRILVQIGAWIPIDKIEIMLKAIREAKS